MKKCFSILCLVFLCLNCKNDDDSSAKPNNPYTFLGEIETINTYGGSNNDRAFAVTKTTNGGYAVLGYTQSNDGDVNNKPSTDFDFWILTFDAENNLLWNKTYGGSQDDRGSDMIQTLDGGFAILGYSDSNDGDITQNAGLQDYWIAKLDASGNMQWQKSFGYSGIDKGTSLMQTNDGGYLITGSLDVTASGGAGNTKQHAGGDYWAIKLDATGNKLWSKYFGGSFTDTPYSLVQTTDNGYIIVGSSDSNDVDINNNKGTYDFWVVKISEHGNLVWEKSFGGSEIDEARGIVASNDGNFFIVGDTRSNNTNVSQNYGLADLWIIKISESGELLQEKTFGGSSFDVARSISLTQENELLIAGSSRSMDGNLTTNQGQNDAWVLKLDNNLNIIWQQTIGGNQIDYFYDAIELDNKNIIAVGESGSNNGDISVNKGFSDVLITKIK